MVVPLMPLVCIQCVSPTYAYPYRVTGTRFPGPDILRCEKAEALLVHGLVLHMQPVVLTQRPCPCHIVESKILRKLTKMEAATTQGPN